ncbi:MAG: alkene reductase [Mucilaginibacter sp.]|nr:alkene reductase [Mucilaginibacter sp.]
MAPMTRSRATADNIPTDLMAEYYGQRAGAGLIITEGTSPSPNGLGYPRIPGIYSAEQVAGWKKVTDAVHEKGGHIFVQIMHTGRVGHVSNLPAGAAVLAPSAITCKGQIFSDTEGMVDISAPREFTIEEVKATVTEYVTAAKNAIAAGFDGVEFHGANGYLIEQFISPATNQRTDEYGGDIVARSRFLLEIITKAAAEIGKDKIGIRFSPYGAFNDMPAYDEIDKTYTYLAEKLNELGILYVHVLDHSSMGAPAVPQEIKDSIRSIFKNKLILGGGFDKEKAEAAIENGSADLIAFGKPFVSNPDLVTRLQKDAELAPPDFSTLYTPGVKGYSDYPFLQEA